ncbi:uncharacterized protein TM35_000331200 [Trypanosoma theileri]|uniref:Uncharacterized protein n=1 Tax=Trypanosoma theileri TaxID=67003 RepID=A0A1X0NME7_9TRYP|nr:uncharacterized protein TM35_000331200 [Trypanosoma theileri]ORC85663.1 hypothetical protein TM35_000331200 [Trypanosoma theileri]
MNEKDEDPAMPAVYDVNVSFADDSYDELDLRYWINSTRRFCVPTVMGVETTNGKPSRSLRSPLPTSGVEQARPVSPAGCSDESFTVWGGTPLPPIQSQSVDVFETTHPSPSTPESRRMIKVALDQRWRSHANGAIRRYVVGPKVGTTSRTPVVVNPRLYRTIDEIASRLAEEREDRRLPHIVFAPPPAAPRQFVVREVDVDPRVLDSEMQVQPQRTVVTPEELQMRMALFENTLGAVRPYASGGEQQRRTGRIPPAMPASALTRDPMEVFVEVMRYQRPGLGVCSFDLH